MHRRRLHPILLLLAVTVAAFGVTGCAAGPPATPPPAPDPSLGPVIAADDDVCAALDVMSQEHLLLREIRLRPANRRALDDQFEQLQLAWRDLLDVAPIDLDDQMDALRWAVIDLGLAVEDYTTTTRFAEAAEHVLREDIAFARTLGHLRARTTCPAWQPTPPPARTSAPGASGGPSTVPPADPADPADPSPTSQPAD